MSGPSSLPPSPPGPPSQPQNMRDGTPAKILSVDGTLSQLSRPATVTGQVVSLSPDGSVRVHTDQGNINLQPRNTATQLLAGQAVEIDLSAGRPPRQATIRPADPAQTRASSGTTGSGSAVAPPPAGAQTGVAATPAPVGGDVDADNGGQRNATPANVDVAGGRAATPLITDAVVAELSGPETAQTPPAAAQVEVESGDLLRLQPLPADTPLLTPGMPPVEETGLKLPTGVILPQTPTDGSLTIRVVVPAATILPKLVAPVFGSAVPPAPLTVPTTTAAPTIAAKTVPAPASLSTPVPTRAAATTPASTSVENFGPVTNPPSAILSTAKPAVQTPLSSAPATGAFRSAPARPFDIRVTAIQSPAPRFAAPATGLPATFVPSAASRSAVSAPAVLTGTVIGHVAQPGFAPLPVLSVTLPGQTVPQFFAMQVAAANLPAGTLVSFTPQAGEIDTAATGDGPPGAVPLPSTQWPVLSIIHESAAAILPRTDLPLAALLPNPGAPLPLPAAALLFVAALRSGDLAGWLGEKTIDALRRAGREDLLARLGSEGTALARLDAPPGVDDAWRVLPLPLLWEGEVQRMMLHYRRDRAAGDKADDRRRRGTRFVFDMALSRMGPVQLDGLHRPKAAADDDDRLDLIVRTRAALSAPMQAAMRLRYHESLAACDHRGEMMFQYRAEQWLKF